MKKLYKKPMYPYVETIRILNGEIMNLVYHQLRFDRTLKQIRPEACPAQNYRLADVLCDRPQGRGVYKARILYNADGILDVSYNSYQPRTIRTLKLVTSDDIEYALKSTDRAQLIELQQQKGESDEIVIVRHGLLTDTSYSNIALWDGKQWYTPKCPLLKGTMRQSLLDQGLLIECDITAQDFFHFEKVSLINAMMPLGTCEVNLR